MIFCSWVMIGVLSKRRGRALRTPTTPRPASASASAMTPTVRLSLNYCSIGQADHVLQPRPVFEPRQGRLGTQVAPAVGQPSAGELERRIAAQHVEVVGILVAAADRKRPRPDHVGDRMGDARAIAPIGNAARQAL